MRETDFERGEAKFTGAGGGRAVKVDRGFAASVVQDFKLSPEDAAHAGAEGLGDGLLPGEAGGEFFGAAAAVVLFAFGVDAAEEAFAETIQGGLDAGDLDGVDAGREASAVGPNSRSAPRAGRRTGIPSHCRGLRAGGGGRGLDVSAVARLGCQT